MGARPPDVVTATMRRVRSRHTAPEVALRKALWSKGLRYRLHSKDLPGNPDLVFTRSHVAVFVDGDYWHGNQWRRRGFQSLEEQFSGVNNSSYWIQKIRRNVERDALATRRLEEGGWHVIRVWESDLKADLPGIVERIASAVKHRKSVV